MAGLYEKLTAYGKTDACPFHMPGHKRNGEKFCFQNPFSFDITEIDGFDNLHHPTGLLKDTMEQAAAVYGSEKTYFLVNGSSCGILAAVSACVRPGGKLLMGRNCHKSVYHGLFLRGLRPVYLCPPVIADWGVNGGISPEEISRALEENPDAEAVLLTSPTYEGICSDIGAIAEIVHAHGIPLIVDSAHGAHFPFRKKGEISIFPASALEQGADIVIESLHKTLPSLTQTAVLHKKSALVKEQDLEWYLQIYQSSSPSYVLMASIDSCISYMAGKEGQADMAEYEENLKVFRKKLENLKYIRLLTGEESGKKSGTAYDASKLVIRGEFLSGTQLYDILREEYQIQPEMCTETYVILMTSSADTKAVFHRLAAALVDIDKKKARSCGKSPEAVVIPVPQVVFTPAEAKEKDTICCTWEEVLGAVSAEFAYLYPPGIPVLVPGEKITGEILGVLERYRKSGLEIQGLQDPEGKTILIMK